MTSSHANSGLKAPQVYISEARILYMPTVLRIILNWQCLESQLVVTEEKKLKDSPGTEIDG